MTGQKSVRKRREVCRGRSEQDSLFGEHHWDHRPLLRNSAVPVLCAKAGHTHHSGASYAVFCPVCDEDDNSLGRGAGTLGSPVAL